MVVGFRHMWIAITSNLIAIMFVVILMTIIKIWMFGAPKKERIIPAYSLHVMKNLPPDKPVTKSKPNPYAKSSNPYTHRIKPSYSQTSQARMANRQMTSGTNTPQFRYPGQPMNFPQGNYPPTQNYPPQQARFI